MSQAFRKNDNSCNNADKSFTTVDSFNNNQNFLSNNDNCFNTNTYNTTTVSHTTVDGRSEILAWLSPLEPRLRHRDIASGRIDDIGEWLLETEEFKRWHKGRRDGSYRPILFCDGNPGVGKSYIVSLVIDKLCDEAVEGNSAVVCFYFDFAARNEQSAVSMLGSLVRQVVSGQGGIPEEIARDFQKEKSVIGGRGLQVSGILKMFKTITATRRTFICIDALDECVPAHRMVVLESLRQMLQGSPNTSLFMTGRRPVRSEVEKELGGVASFVLIRATEDGVLRFLRQKLRKDTMPNMMSSILEGDIMRSIPAISSETFLLASLHIELILRGTTVARRRKILKTIKDGVGLGDAYSATLERIKAQDEEKATLAISALTWVCHSERPLQVDELCQALAVEIGETDFDPENVPSIGTLLEYCQGLIAVDAEASTVRLIHYTVQEYLCSHPSLFSKPHSILAETCLTYLNSQQIKSLTSHSHLDHGSMPFLKYSARYWGTHADKDLSDNVKTLALELLNRYEDHISAVSLLGQALDPRYRGVVSPSTLFTGLHCASYFGVVELVTVLMNAGDCNVNQQDCTSSTPLGWAAVNGHEGVVKVLLERKSVDPNCPDKSGNGPLGRAAMWGREGVMKILLGQQEIDPNWQDMNGLTPLGWAAARGHEGVVKVLLERENVDPNRPEKHDRTPLECAAIGGHEGVVKLLLEREDVDPNHPDKDGYGPLDCAACFGHEGVAKVLLGRQDVDPNRRDKNDRTPLGTAACLGHEGVVKILLEREDVDPNRPCNWDRTPLGCAAVEGHEGVVKLLLERKDVDPNLPDEDGDGPLGCAAISGHEGVVKILLERQDVDPNRPNNNHRTPLGCAAIKGHGGVVKLLLERENVDPNLPEKGGNGPLGCAAILGNERVVKILLERQDVDPNRPNHNGQTPLGYAAMQGHEGVVKLLLEREDVDTECPDECHIGPLGWAALLGHEGVVNLLQERGDVGPNCPDKYGGAPLSYAARDGHGRMVELLRALESVAIPDAQLSHQP